MPSKFRLLPYKIGSQSGRELIQELDGLRVNPTAHTYRRKDAHRIINWGNSDCRWGDLFRSGDFNAPAAVSSACNKLHSFKLFGVQGVRHPEWTDSYEASREWLSNGWIVYGRDTQTGTGGIGITTYQDVQGELGRHLFYTKGVRVKYEYRVHVGRGPSLHYFGMIDLVQKRQKNGHQSHPLIRSHNHGWVFCRNGIVTPPDCVIEEAYRAVAALNLDFGAVDVCLTKQGEPVVFEVNTAPGLEGTTLTKYKEFLS
jgi:hypothetical protein